MANPQVIRQAFAEASDALGQDLWQMIAEGPADVLAQTVNTQPLMLTAGIAVYREAGLPAVVPFRPWSPATAWASIRRWLPPACSNLKDAVKLVRTARPGHAGGRARRAKAPWRRCLGLDAAQAIEACAEAAQGRWCRRPISTSRSRS
jgi:[acyl-carrier-protein] S-malonyltransferase